MRKVRGWPIFILTFAFAVGRSKTPDKHSVLNGGVPVIIRAKSIKRWVVEGHFVSTEKRAIFHRLQAAILREVYPGQVDRQDQH